MASNKEILTDALNKLKAEKSAKIETEYAKVRQSEIVPKQQEIESSKIKAVAAYNKEHQDNLHALAEELSRKKAEAQAEYDAKLKSENDSYATQINSLNESAAAKKTELETTKKAEIEASVAAELDSNITALENMIANLK